MKQYIKILKCSEPTYWYRDSIGKVIEYQYKTAASTYLLPDSCNYVHASDCVECGEKGNEYTPDWKCKGEFPCKSIKADEISETDEVYVPAVGTFVVLNEDKIAALRWFTPDTYYFVKL